VKGGEAISRPARESETKAAAVDAGERGERATVTEGGAATAEGGVAGVESGAASASPALRAGAADAEGGTPRL
jgi:hypothetical protein